MKVSSPSALRNRDPIGEVLRDVLPARGLVLEIASGSGEHVIHFAQLFPNLTWQPSDPSKEARASIADWTRDAGTKNILPPLDIDTTLSEWPVDRAEGILAINMVHISPWAATLGLLNGAANLLPQHGALVLYGPYRRKGQAMAQSNIAFDQSLRNRNPSWGIRQLEDVERSAQSVNLTLDHVIDMPANNICVIFKKE